jgi:hypothetical protein
MSIHVLAGDALAADFKNTNIAGEVVVCRECLIEGDVKSENLEDFWRARAAFIEETYGADDNSYFENVAGELQKLTKFGAGDTINLWFEYELFCQANMWFCLSLLSKTKAEIFRVAPVVRSEKDIWKGFGRLNANELQTCFEQRTKFSEEDVLLGKDLWKAFQKKDFGKLKELSRADSKCFPYLKEACEAACEIEKRPKKTLEKIVSGGESDFNKIFASFALEEGVYGFGDAQVKRILQEI